MTENGKSTRRSKFDTDGALCAMNSTNSIHTHMHTSITNVAWCALKYCVSESSLHEWLSLFCPYYVLKRRRYVSFCLEYIVRVLLTNLSNSKRLSLHFFHTRNVAAFIRINLNPLKRHIVIYMICMHLWGRIVMRTHARIKPIFRFDFAVRKKERIKRASNEFLFVVFDIGETFF